VRCGAVRCGAVRCDASLPIINAGKFITHGHNRNNADGYFRPSRRREKISAFDQQTPLDEDGAATTLQNPIKRILKLSARIVPYIRD